MLNEFREFIAKGNVIDLAVGVIIGAAFQRIVDSLVTDVVMPVVGLATGGTDFTNMFAVLRDGLKVAGPYASLAEAKAAGATVIALWIIRDAGGSVPHPRVGRLPDGQGDQSNAPDSERRSARE